MYKQEQLNNMIQYDITSFDTIGHITNRCK